MQGYNRRRYRSDVDQISASISSFSELETSMLTTNPEEATECDSRSAIRATKKEGNPFKLLR